MFARVLVADNEGGSETKGPISLIHRLFAGRPTISPTFYWGLFILIAIAATGFRFSNAFNNSLWMDEAITAGLARLPLKDILFNNIDYHPPLSFAVQHIWVKLVPDPQFYRFPVALVGSLTIIVLMGAMSDRVSRPTALVAGLVLALMTGHIYYSQDMRPYAFIPFGLAFAVWGALGLTEAGKDVRHKWAYVGLYVFGGYVAIYTQVIGLIGMACIGFGSLAGGIMENRGSLRQKAVGAKHWLYANLILFVLALPYLLSIQSTTMQHAGFDVETPLSDLLWFYRQIVGFPGLEELNKGRDLLEVLALGAAFTGAGIAWLRGRFSLSLIILGLIAVFPLIMALIHLHKNISHARMFVPCTLGMAMGMAYAITALSSTYLRTAALAVFTVAGLGSSTYEQMHHNTIEDYKTAFKYIDERNYQDAPVLTCFDYSAAAIWETRNDATIIVALEDGAYRYPGPEYWGMMGEGVNVYRTADTRFRGEYNDKANYYENGLKQALNGHDQLVVAHVGCFTSPDYTTTPTALKEMGFVEVEDTRIWGKAKHYPIIVGAGTRLHFYERVNTIASGAS